MSRIGRRYGGVLGRMTGTLLQRISRTGSLRVASDELELNGHGSCAGLAERLLRDVDRGHVIVPFWSRDQLTIALLAAERHGLRRALSRFEIVADDSIGGEIMWRVGEKFGLQMRRIHARGNPSRLEDLAEWLRHPTPFFIAVDGGSVYGTVPTGIVRMAARLGSTVWPMAVHPRRRVRVPGIIADIPLPGTNLGVGVSRPLRVARAASIAEVTADVKQRLERASRLARAYDAPADDSGAATLREPHA